MTGFLVVLGLIMLVALIPCEYDPAIWFKEWTERQRK